MHKNIVFKYRCFLKNLSIRKECNLSSCILNIAVTYNLKVVTYFSSFISLLINVSVSLYLNFKPFRQSINYRCTNTVKSSGHLVSSTTEFTSGMKNRIYYFNGRSSCFMINVNRYTSTIINNSDRVIFIDHNLNVCTKTC